MQEFYDPDTVQLMEWISQNTRMDAAFTGSMQLLAGVKLCTHRHITNHPHFEDKWLRERTKRLYQIYARKSPKEVQLFSISIQCVQVLCQQFDVKISFADWQSSFRLTIYNFNVIFKLTTVHFGKYWQCFAAVNANIVAQWLQVYDILRREGTTHIIVEDSICLATSDGCRTPDLMDLENGDIPDSGMTWGLSTLKHSRTPRFCDEIRKGEGDYLKYFRKELENRTFRVYQLLV